MSIMRLENITKIYGQGSSEVAALKNINMTVNKGDFITIMGPSGCGKSTLLNVLGCIDYPSQGNYWIQDKNVDFKKLNSLSDIRNNKIAIIFQNFALIKELTVLENVVLPLKFRKMKKKDKINIARKYLTELKIEDLQNKYINQLSGGQQQRVAIARALSQETDIILADEPTGALDQENSKNIMEIIQNLNKKYGKTIIIVTHDNMVAGFCNSILRMQDGSWINN